MDSPTQLEPSTLSWCPDCCRYTVRHPLIHQLERHAPQGVGPGGNWRTAVLQERVA